MVECRVAAAVLHVGTRTPPQAGDKSNNRRLNMRLVRIPDENHNNPLLSSTLYKNTQSPSCNLKSEDFLILVQKIRLANLHIPRYLSEVSFDDVIHVWDFHCNPIHTIQLISHYLDLHVASSQYKQPKQPHNAIVPTLPIDTNCKQGLR